jgi:hypothetical protein
MLTWVLETGETTWITGAIPEERPPDGGGVGLRVIVAAGAVGLAGMIDGNARRAGVSTGVADGCPVDGCAVGGRVAVAGAGAGFGMVVHAPTAESTKIAVARMGIKCLDKLMGFGFGISDWRHPTMALLAGGIFPRGC